MPVLEVDTLAFIETARSRVDRVIKATEAARAGGLTVDPDAPVHGVVLVPSHGWIKTGPVVSPLGAVCLDMQPGDVDVVRATAQALLASVEFAAGMEDGTRARPDAEKVADPSYLRGLEFGYEVRFRLKRPPFVGSGTPS